MKWIAKWIKPIRDMQDVASVFVREFFTSKDVKTAILTVTSIGVYEAKLNDQRISNYVLAPGWTTYKKRLQYQQYDITDYLCGNNLLCITVGKGWYRSNMSGRMLEELKESPCGLLAQIEITYADGQKEVIGTDEQWKVSESEIRFSEIYDGEVCDGRFVPDCYEKTAIFDGLWNTLIPQEGEKITEHERLSVAQIITTPKGETVIDFGQEITGYVQITVDAKAGDMVKLSHGEVLDKDGNFYNDNYRAAKAELCYICRDGLQTYHPRLTFYGFRYIRVDEFPGGIESVNKDNFTAIAVYSDIKRTGYLQCSNPLLNKFFDNVIWGQKDNFLDIPTDCPQRDERLGWTGDAQVFVRAAALNFDVEKFFAKWLGCMEADQLEDGYIGHMIPDTWQFEGSPAAWGDAAVICPWELYLAYGNPQILRKQFVCMKKYIDYITNNTQKEYLWIGGFQYGDWLGLDGKEDHLRGGSRNDFIASAYYAYSVSLFIKAGKILGENVSEYEGLYNGIVKAFQETFNTYTTQTECALAIHFRLAKDCQVVSDQLAEMIQEAGMQLTTGFVGTPYLLHALSDFGHADIAYLLLLREEYPSWLYAVKRGATTVWEHWDSLKEDGSFWDTSMNSFNHYAYGAVTDWVYCVAAGITRVEEYPGYEKVKIAPIPDDRLDWLKASLETRHGLIQSGWKKEKSYWRYEITTPVDAEIVIDGTVHEVKAGSYLFYG